VPIRVVFRLAVFSQVKPGSGGMTIKHEVWLADAIAGSALMLALYLILVEFSKARLP
jgi:hypothetical protein